MMQPRKLTGSKPDETGCVMPKLKETKPCHCTTNSPTGKPTPAPPTPMPTLAPTPRATAAPTQEVLSACTLGYDTQTTFGTAKRLVFQTTMASILSQSLYQDLRPSDIVITHVAPALAAGGAGAGAQRELRQLAEAAAGVSGDEI